MLNQRKLVYYCVGYNNNYNKMLELSIISLKMHYDGDILVITDYNNMLLLKQKNIFNDIKFMIVDKPIDKFMSAINRMKIYEYSHFFDYDQILYLDTDILIIRNISNIFNETNKHQCIGIAQDRNKNCKRIEWPWITKYNFDNFWGRFLFNVKNIDINNKRKALNSGVICIPTTSKSKMILEDIYHHAIENHNNNETKTINLAYGDQPYINYYLYLHSYFFLLDDVYLPSDDIVLDNLSDIRSDFSIIHFLRPDWGDFDIKYNRMLNMFPRDNKLSLFYKNDTLKYKISFCVTCMNRCDFLKKTLLSNLNVIYKLRYTYNCEIVLINYDSSDDMDEYMKQFEWYISEKFLIYKKVSNKEFFHRTNAKNIAHLNATGDILCNSDVDCYLSKELIVETYDVFIKYGLDNIIFHSKWNYNFGYICLSKYNFNLIKGYNENLYYYGIEDWEILIRFCMKTGHHIKNMIGNYRELVIDHNDILRKTNNYNKEYTSFINAIIVNYNLENNIVDVNDDFGLDKPVKYKEIFNFDFFNKYMINNDFIINVCKNLYYNKNNWLDEEILKKFDDFIIKNNI